MPFDDKKYHAPADHADVARVALQASIALDSAISALRLIAKQGDVDISYEINRMIAASAKLDEYFDALTGYTANAGQ